MRLTLTIGRPGMRYSRTHTHTKTHHCEYAYPFVHVYISTRTIVVVVVLENYGFKRVGKLSLAANTLLQTSGEQPSSSSAHAATGGTQPGYVHAMPYTHQQVSECWE